MVHVQCSRAIPVVSNRRQSGDIYTTLQQDKTDVRMQCPVDNATYLVEERQCINNHYLFDGNLKVLFHGSCTRAGLECNLRSKVCVCKKNVRPRGVCLQN